MISLDSVHWPEALPSDFRPKGAVYMGAMGFEDRALAFLENVAIRKETLETIIAIEYLPYNKANRKEDFLRLARQVSRDVRIIVYDRFSPEHFAEQIPKIFRGFGSKKVIIDVSGLSKLGIVIALHRLIHFPGEITVFYSEAKTYHPTKEEFEQQKASLSVADTPAFLTTQVHDIIGTTSLSSVSMPGAPIALVAFPTFNHVELRALLNEVTPQRLFLLDGLPPDASNRWRHGAIEEINSTILQHVDQKTTVSTLNYLETIEALETFYDSTRYTHRLVVAPTGSKMQSLGVSLFKQIHPDIQIIYPVAESFVQEYSDGWANPWEITFRNFESFSSTLQSLRRRSLQELVVDLAKRGSPSITDDPI